MDIKNIEITKNDLFKNFLIKDEFLCDNYYLLDIRNEIKNNKNIWLIKYFLYLDKNYSDIHRLFGEIDINNIFLVCNRFHHMQNCLK